MADIPEITSAEVLSKYTVDRDTQSFAMVAKDNPKDLVQVELGDSKDPTTVQPQLKVMRWDNEVNLSVRLKDFTDYTISTEGEKIKLVNHTQEVHLYDLPIDEKNPEGGYEFRSTNNGTAITTTKVGTISVYQAAATYAGFKTLLGVGW